MRKMMKTLKLYESELLERLADDLVEMHNATGIELQSWENALELVELFYNTYHTVTIGKKKIQ
jgi:Tat protein secretion system quality control protein TatD with DNase activity